MHSASGQDSSTWIRPLYSAAERARRDRSVWTRVQGILAPIQFLVCAASTALVIRYLMTGHGLGIANASVLAKTLVLYAIMVTGSLWERDVFGQLLFAPAFFWEDAVSMVVIALHTAYVVALATSSLEPRTLSWLALLAYATYFVNAAQFLYKFRRARMGRSQGAPDRSAAAEASV